MKKILILLLLVIISISLIAEDFYSQDENINKIMEKIKTEQNVKDTSKININKVGNSYLEKLGSLYMDIMHPNEQEHELMENMMGGENSLSLKSMHIAMGYSYLSSLINGKNNLFLPFTKQYGFNIKNNFLRRPIMGWMHGWYPLMGWNFFNIGGLIMIILLLASIGVIVFLFVKYRNREQGNSLTNNNRPIDILKERYAKGEITKEEFDKMKIDLL